MTDEQETCNAKDLAALFGLTLPRIYQLVKEGVLEKHGVGKFDRDASVTAYCRYLRGALQQQGSGSSNAELKQSRVELLGMQKKNAELAYQQKTGQLLLVADVEAVMMEAAAIFTGQKRALGSRLSSKLASMTDPKAILKLLNSENDKILANTAAKFGEITNIRKTGTNRKTTARKKSQRVGKRKPGVTARKSGAGAVAK